MAQWNQQDLCSACCVFVICAHIALDQRHLQLVLMQESPKFCKYDFHLWSVYMIEIRITQGDGFVEIGDIIVCDIKQDKDW